MKLPNIWGQGAIFSYSAAIGECKASESLSARLCADSLGFYFLTENRCKMSLYSPHITDISFECVMTDLICAKLKCGYEEYALRIIFSKSNMVFMESECELEVQLLFESPVNSQKIKGCSLFTTETETFFLCSRKEGGCIKYVFSYGNECQEEAIDELDKNADDLIADRMEFYAKIPQVRIANERLEKLYYRCASVLLACVSSPEGIIKNRYITPSKGNKNAMYSFWSALSTLGMRHLAPDIARETLESILASIAGDGMISGRISATEKNSEAAPPILAWCFWELYQINGDKQMLSDAYNSLKRYIHYLMETRDINKNHLYEWQIADNADEYGAESTMDNSPRFDDGIIMDCIDFTSYVANEAYYMKTIATEIAKRGESLYWDVTFERIKTSVNELLFDENDKTYYDRAIVSEMFKKTKTSASFLPLFAGICDNRHSMALLKYLNNEEQFNLKFGIPSVSYDSENYEDNMWRGPMHIHMNSLISRGLERYTMQDKANEIKAKSLEAVIREFEDTGIIFEYYSAGGEKNAKSLSKKSYSASDFLALGDNVNTKDFAPTAAIILDMLFSKAKKIQVK